MILQNNWPTNEMLVSGTNITIRGVMSDETGTIEALVTNGDGTVSVIPGLVERDHTFWIENVPLNGTGPVDLLLQATDAAGNVTATNLTINPSPVTLTIDWTPTGTNLWAPTGSVEGTVSDEYATVIVNGVQVTWDNGYIWNGQWVIYNAPIYGEGTATFDVVAYDASGKVEAQALMAVEKPAYCMVMNHICTKNYDRPATDQLVGYQYSSLKNYFAQTNSVAGGPWHLGYTGKLDVNESGNSEGGPYEQIYAWSDTNPGTEQDFNNGNLGYSGVFQNQNPYYSGNSWFYGEVLSVPDEDQTGPGDSGYEDPPMMHHYYADNAGGGPLTVNARTVVKLYTGGKSVVGQKSLFYINAWATACFEPGNLASGYSSYVPEAWWGTPTAMVKNSYLTVGKKQVGADGKLWVAFPDNSEQDITVTADGVHHYDAGVTVTKYKLSVVANNNDLGTTTPTFCVGQKVNFTANWSPSEPACSEIVAHWKLPQKFVNEPYIYVYDNGTCTTYIRDDQLLHVTAVGAGTSPGTGCWFINGPGGACLVSMNLTFPNGQVVFIQARGFINIYLPSFSTSSASAGKIAVYPGTWHQLYLEIMGLQPPTGAGIGLAANVYSQIPGTAQFVQVFKGYTSGTAFDYNTAGSNWLDTADPYPVSGSSTHTAGDRGFAAPQLTDQPSDACPSSPAVDNNTFTDYLQFMPDDGPGQNIFVTLATSTWTFNGTATETGGVWSVVGPAPSPTQLVSSDAFPIWIHTFSP
jgi:hypothetical protein